MHEILFSKGVEKILARLKKNALIHEYREILTRRVYDILQNKLGDFNTFAKRIIEYLKTSEAD